MDLELAVLDPHYYINGQMYSLLNLGQQVVDWPHDEILQRAISESLAVS